MVLKKKKKIKKKKEEKKNVQDVGAVIDKVIEKHSEKLTEKEIAMEKEALRKVFQEGC